MGQYFSAGDTSLDEIIRRLQLDVGRQKRATRLPAASIDTGNVIVKGAILRPLEFGDALSPFVPPNVPLVNSDEAYSDWITIPKPEWANSVLLLATGSSYNNVRSTAVPTYGRAYTYSHLQFGTNEGPVAWTEANAPAFYSGVSSVTTLAGPIYQGSGSAALTGFLKSSTDLSTITEVSVRIVTVTFGVTGFDAGSNFQPKYSLTAIWTRND